MKKTKLKNMTTKIPAARTISEIEAILMEIGATGIYKKNDGFGRVSLLYFEILAGDRLLTISLPCKFEKIQKYLIDGKTTYKKEFKNITHKQLSDGVQAYNVGWRLLKDWLSSQMSMIQVNMTSLEQIFLPYVYDKETETTLFEQYSSNLPLLDGE